MYKREKRGDMGMDPVHNAGNNQPLDGSSSNKQKDDKLSKTVQDKLKPLDASSASMPPKVGLVRGSWNKVIEMIGNLFKAIFNPSTKLTPEEKKEIRKNEILTQELSQFQKIIMDQPKGLTPPRSLALEYERAPNDKFLNFCLTELKTEEQLSAFLEKIPEEQRAEIREKWHLQQKN